MITYRTGNELDLDVVIDLYRDSTLGERRPVDDHERMAAMLHHANLVVTAWDGDLLVGIARSFSDFIDEMFERGRRHRVRRVGF